MPNYLHRTTKEYLVSTSPASLTEPEANFIMDPNLSAVAGQPSKYWIIAGDLVTLMAQPQRDVVDAAELEAQRDSIEERLANVEDILRAFLLVLIDELNSRADKVNAILDAIDSATNLASVKVNIAAIADYPQRTAAQLRTEIRNKLGS